jgi:hypothetical protein
MGGNQVKKGLPMGMQPALQVSTNFISSEKVIK